MNYSPDEERVLRICLNGKKYEKSFLMQVSRSINSLRRLKDSILSNLKSNANPDKVKIYNYKGIEIDEADIDYLTDGQYFYVSLDGSSFSILNYINEYEIIKAIKSGGYGKVYLAQHTITGKKVAIKENDVTNLSNEEIYNISREALYLETLKHKNIIKYINSYSYDSNFYMVMQYAEGGELGSYVQSEVWLTEEKVKLIFSQMVDAIKLMHSKNVIHRDLKPNNILFLDKEKENIAIIDFGISGYSYGNIHEKVKAGTVKFVPPEIASGISYSSSSKIDIWSLGIIFYYMLFGVFPFEGKSDHEITEKIIRDNFKLPVNIPISKACYSLLRGLLEKNQMLRIELNSNLIDDWLNDKTVLEYPKKKHESLPKEAITFEIKLEGDENNTIWKEPAKFEVDDEVKYFKSSKQVVQDASSEINHGTKHRNTIQSNSFKKIHLVDDKKGNTKASPRKLTITKK